MTDQVPAGQPCHLLLWVATGHQDPLQVMPEQQLHHPGEAALSILMKMPMIHQEVAELTGPAEACHNPEARETLVCHLPMVLWTGVMATEMTASEDPERVLQVEELTLPEEAAMPHCMMMKKIIIMEDL